MGRVELWSDVRSLVPKVDETMKAELTLYLLIHSVSKLLVKPYCVAGTELGTEMFFSKTQSLSSQLCTLISGDLGRKGKRDN